MMPFPDDDELMANLLRGVLSAPPPIPVAHDQNVNGAIIDTTFTGDTSTYETGILHNDYYEHWIIVEKYTTEEQAKEGHAAWVKVFQGELPEILRDVSTTPTALVMDSYDERGSGWREFHRKD